MSKGVLMVFSGPSGCGKGTVLKEFFAQGGQAFLSVSATTRSPRPGEEDGVHYYFLSKEDFESKIAQDEILEHACYCGNYYGTPRGPVYERLERGENVILEIEVQGALQIREKCPEAVLVFILPPSLQELKRRLVDRNTEDMETVERRLNAAADEIRMAYQYDYVVVNDALDDAVQELKTIFAAEKLKAANRKKIIDEVLEL
ncbi:MAG TPA: guanylate kinase [Candidatus Merdivicinus intestinigallinarum]|nr:guanylate kinase [Candidatus Merdivicinus intestinigallinarum]